MNRRAARAALLAGLAVLAIAVAAATLPSPVETGSDGVGVTGGPGPGGLLPIERGAPPPATDGPGLPGVVVALLVVAGIVGLAIALVRYPRVALGLLVGSVLLAGLGVLIARLLTLLFSSSDGLPPPEGPGSLLGGAAGSLSPGSGTAPPVRPLVLAAVLAVAVLAALVALRRSGRSLSTDGGRAAAAVAAPAGAAAAVGRAAGRAADRLEADAPDRPVENEVYRAWREMTAGLDVSRPESTTPGEFEAAAVAAGVDPEHARELTRLFEDARYGGHEPTADDEARAVEVLRRVEAAYAERSADDSGGDR